MRQPGEVPQQLNARDPVPLVLGTKMTTTADVDLFAIRFYKATGESTSRNHTARYEGLAVHLPPERGI